MKKQTCPCRKYDVLVPPAGPVDADILIIGPYPGEEEMSRGLPWVGPAGQALEAELFLNDICLDECRRMNIWWHPKDKECDVTWHLDRALAEVKKHPFVLFLGSDTCKLILDRKVSDISSLTLRLKSYNLPTSVKAAMAVVNPADAIATSAGELKLGIRRFAEMVRRKGYGRSIS